MSVPSEPRGRGGWSRWLCQRPLPTLSMIFQLAVGVGIAAAAWSVYGALDGSRVEALERVVHRVVSAPEDASPALISLAPLTGRWGLLTSDERTLAASSPIPTRQSSTFVSRLPVAEGPGRPAAPRPVRFCERDLFEMFRYGWVAGGPWGERRGGVDEPPVAVVSDDALAAIFGPEASPEAVVGRSLYVHGRGPYRVVGVTTGPPLAYQGSAAQRHRRESVYLPWDEGLAVAPVPAAVIRGERAAQRCGHGCAAPRDRWLVHWVELPDDAARRAYVAWIGRRSAATSPSLTLRSLAAGIALESGWERGLGFIVTAANLLLLLAALSVAGMLRGKLLERAPEVRIHRALGASRWTILRRHVAEAAVMAALSGGLGLLIALGMVAAVAASFEGTPPDVGLSERAALLAPVLASIAWIVAAAPPIAWVSALPAAAGAQGREG